MCHTCHILYFIKFHPDKSSSSCAKREMDALNAESELNLKRFESEQIKIENYHQALLEKRLNEQESKFRSKIESIGEFVCRFHVVATV